MVAPQTISDPPKQIAGMETETERSGGGDGIPAMMSEYVTRGRSDKSNPGVEKKTWHRHERFGFFSTELCIGLLFSDLELSSRTERTPYNRPIRVSPN